MVKLKTNMKLLLSICLIAMLFSCKNEPTIQAKTEKYIKDSLLSSFNDPLSFQLVSVDTETITSHMSAKYDIKSTLSDIDKMKSKIESNKNLFTNPDKSDIASLKSLDSSNKEVLAIFDKRLKECNAQLLAADSIDHINIAVKYRAKNKMGALILDEMLLMYFPFNKTFTRM